jgi:hypothetical protein
MVTRSSPRHAFSKSEGPRNGCEGALSVPPEVGCCDLKARPLYSSSRAQPKWDNLIGCYNHAPLAHSAFSCVDSGV